MSTESVAPAPAPEPQQKKPSVVKRILTTIVAIVVAFGVYYAFNYFTSDAAQTKAGDCAAVSGTTSAPEFKTAGCDAAEANYIVGKTFSNLSEKCGEGYDEYTETQSRGPKTKLCLFPKLVEGECYDFGGDNMGYPKAVCGSGEKVVKVTKVIKDAEPDCGDLQPYAVAEPKLAYCLGQE